MKRIQMIMIIAILLGVVTPACTIAGPSPRHGPPQGPPPGYGDDRGYDEYPLRADVGSFYDELSPAAVPKQKDTKGKGRTKEEDPQGRLENRGETLEWMDLHPRDGFELPGPEKLWYICELRLSESFCHQLDLELLAGYSSSSCSSA